MTCGGKDDEEERTKRSFARATLSGLRGARARIAWCMVGTAVYQLGSASSIHWKNFRALKPGVQTTEGPAESGKGTAAMRPWMWKSGRKLRQRSAGISASISRMFFAEAARLACVSGTILGRDGVPDVWSTSATSPG